MKHLLSLIFLGGIGYYIYSKSKVSVDELVQSMTFTPNDISVNTDNLTDPKIIVNFAVNNPTNQPFVLTKIYGTINSGDYQLATINNNTNITIAANQVSNLPIRLNVDTLNVVKDIIAGNIGKTFEIDGYAMAGLVKIPFSEVLNISIPSWL